MTPPDTKSAEEQANVLPRYGIEWTGPQTPISVPRADGFWTPWHLAAAALRAAKIEAWQEAARAVCVWCRAGKIDNANIGAAVWLANAWRHPVKWRSGGETDIGCAAFEIHALIAAAAPPRVAEPSKG